MLKRRKDLEKRAPRAMRKVDKVRVYEDSTGKTIVLVGAKWRSEAELLDMAANGHAAKEAFNLMAAPAIGGLQ
ncbi:MAG: hypothetical protein KKA22_03985 [Gammaproteobacteria bacterium]|nr:hypothetical protein [Gammaproteobacteria bacterium]MBU1407289.1 hypothetical protein [Gammaproteobacteria bacterium]MBU1531337.1 hypothetical protein [Gammaproteobacteria bacterium]